MKGKLLTQMLNEWKSNLWLLVELLVVSIVGWYIADFSYVRIYNALSFRGFDISHTYLLDVEQISPNSPEWRGEKSADEARADRLQLLDRLNHRPEIEVAAIGQNSRPYTGSNSGLPIAYKYNDTTVIQTYFYNVKRWVTPDFIKVFRYEGVNGETPEELAAILERDEILLSDNVFEGSSDLRASEIVGKEVYLYSDTLQPIRVGASLKMIRYHDYEDWINQSSLIKLDDVLWGNEWVVRVKDNMDKDFARNLMADADRSLRVGNLYIGNVTSLEDLRENFQRSSTNDLRNYMTGMGFLMLNVFLGLFGTFWFRTRQRMCEIALRKAVGASKTAVMRRLVSEGVILLTIASVIAIVIDYVLTQYGFNAWFHGGFFAPGRFAVCVVATYLLLLLMIVAGISIPAYQAMKINPATALHDE